MKKVLVLLLLTLMPNLSLCDEQSRIPEDYDVMGWLDRPDAIVDFEVKISGPCKLDEVEYEGISYSSLDLFTPFYYPIKVKYGYIPPGLWFKSLIKDSTLYVVEAGICFNESQYYNFPKDDSITKIPLKLIFPDSKSDTVHANFVTNELLLVDKEGRAKIFALIKKGKIFRTYVKGTPSEGKFLEDEEAYQFEINESKDCNGTRPECNHDSNSEYYKLMDRLKPYYFKKESHKKIFEDEIEFLKQMEKARSKNSPHTEKF